ncbi:phosphopantothenoylcysteine decarboxylase [Mollicutes bacterium LVI A0039]|nr:phosphopantothenoylcysteine decarboxylase [Mollicutes bacterium LVI A0039]
MKYIITSGPMVMEIDSVRNIKNSSTGKLGAIFAETLVAKTAAEVVYIHTAGAILPTVEVNAIEIKNHEQLIAALTQELTADSVVIHAMAISDFKYGGSVDIERLAQTIFENLATFTCADAVKTIIKDSVRTSSKLASNSDQLLLLNQADKIIDKIKTICPQARLVGFKLLSNVDKQELINVAVNMKQRAGCDLVVANLKEQVHGGEHHAYIISDTTIREAHTKEQIATMVIEEMEQI